MFSPQLCLLDGVGLRNRVGSMAWRFTKASCNIIRIT